MDYKKKSICCIHLVLLLGADGVSILDKKIEEFYEQHYGTGNAAEKLSQILKEQIK